MKGPAMAPTDFRTLKDKNDALVMSAQDWLVLLHDWTPGASYIPADLCDSSGVLQTLPAGWFTSGAIQKAAGVSLAPDTQTDRRSVARGTSVSVRVTLGG